MNPLLLPLACVATSLLPAGLQDPATDVEAPRTSYLGRDVAQTMHWRGASWLTREEREGEERTSRLLGRLGLELGQTVVDFGCGNGYLALAIAPKLGPAGRVIGVDIQQPMLDLFAGRAGEAGIENYELVLSTATDPCLPAATADLIVMLDVYHELDRPETVLAAARAALVPGGRLAFVEFRAEDRAVPIKPEHKMSVAQLACELGFNGLTILDEFDGLPWQHLVFAGPAEQHPEGSTERSHSAAREVARAFERAWRARQDSKLALFFDPVLLGKTQRAAALELLGSTDPDLASVPSALRCVSASEVRWWQPLGAGDLVARLGRDSAGRWLVTRLEFTP